MSTEREELDPLLADAIAGLRNQAPQHDLWPAIAPRLTRRYPPGTFVLRWPVALAAGITLVIVSVTGTLAALRHLSPEPILPGADAISASDAAKVSAPADSSLLLAIGKLEKQLAAGDKRLDTKTRLSVRQSLTALDQAIADIAAARRANPENAEVAKYLTSTLQKKLDMLKSVVLSSVEQVTTTGEP